MKKLKNLMLVTLIGMSVLGTWSCNNEELYEEPAAVVDDGSNEDADVAVTDVNSPCDFSLENLDPNSTVVINCILDLQGEALDLPENVTLLDEGGDIINGTLNFSEGSAIDGDLLGSTLTVGGTKPALRDVSFTFDPKRWGIVEGVVSDEVALKNRDILENTMVLAKEYGIDTFRIDEMDAYFLVSRVTSGTSNRNFYSSVEAINVPADFNLVMTDNTNLRVFPNDAPKYSLLAVRDVSNVTITGGNLYGDRDEHDYSTGDTTHEWGHIIDLHAATDAIIDGVKAYNGSGDGLKVHSLGFTFESNYRPSHNIIIKNCVFDSNRRNNISVTDGFDIYIENNELLNAGVDTKNSKGTNPKFGIDIEATRTSDGNGGYIFYEKSERIYIRSNTERGSIAGAMTVHIGNDVIIEGNITEKGLSYTYATGTKIINNTLNAGSTGGDTGIKGGTKLTTADSIFDNEISGNVIDGFNVGINVQNRNTLVYDNLITDFLTGIYPIRLWNSKIYNNKMVSDRDSSRGIVVNGSTIDGVIIENNDITTKSNPILLSRCNNTDESSNNSSVFISNVTNSLSYSRLISANGISFNSNKFNNGFEIYDSNNIEFYENQFTTEIHDAIYLRQVNTNITILGNIINVSDKRECIRYDESTSKSEVTDSGNTCI